MSESEKQKIARLIAESANTSAATFQKLGAFFEKLSRDESADVLNAFPPETLKNLSKVMANGVTAGEAFRKNIQGGLKKLGKASPHAACILRDLGIE